MQFKVYFHFNLDFGKRQEHYFGLICSTFLLIVFLLMNFGNIVQICNEEVDIKVHQLSVTIHVFTKKFDLDGSEILDRVFVTINNPAKDDVFMETRQ